MHNTSIRFKRCKWQLHVNENDVFADGTKERTSVAFILANGICNRIYGEGGSFISRSMRADRLPSTVLREAATVEPDGPFQRANRKNFGRVRLKQKQSPVWCSLQ